MVPASPQRCARPSAAISFVTLLLLLLAYLLGVSVGKRVAQSSEEYDVRLLVIGDWGRQGTQNQTQVRPCPLRFPTTCICSPPSASLVVRKQVAMCMDNVAADFKPVAVISTGDNFYGPPSIGGGGLTGIHDPNFVSSFVNVRAGTLAPWTCLALSHAAVDGAVSAFPHHVHLIIKPAASNPLQVYNGKNLAKLPWYAIYGNHDYGDGADPRQCSPINNTCTPDCCFSALHQADIALKSVRALKKRTRSADLHSGGVRLLATHRDRWIPVGTCSASTASRSAPMARSSSSSSVRLLGWTYLRL